MGELGYDAVGLGNHDFNYGLDFLEASLQGAPFPFLCANVVRAGGAAFLPPYAILNRTFKDDAGAGRELRVGVVGFAASRKSWRGTRRTSKGSSRRATSCSPHRRLVPELRAKCDLVVALCHAGIKAGSWDGGRGERRPSPRRRAGHRHHHDGTRASRLSGKGLCRPRRRGRGFRGGSTAYRPSCQGSGGVISASSILP